MNRPPVTASSINSTEFLVCGLGHLGQYCVVALKKFGVNVTGIELHPPTWQMPDVAQMLDQLLIGDYRYPTILQQARVTQCRAVLIVTSNERVNIEIAFAVRSLNPQARLVVRSSQDNLNALLSQELGNFTAFATNQLSAVAFALAAASGEMRSFFDLDHQSLRVMQIQITPNHPWCDRRFLHELNTWNRRILGHSAQTEPISPAFYSWDPTAMVQAGDTLTYIELSDTGMTVPTTSINQLHPLTGQAFWSRWTRPAIRRQLRTMWEQVQQNQTQRVGLLSAAIMLGLFLLGTVLYKLQYPNISLQDAVNVALVLAIGGYDNLFGQLKIPFPIPGWLHSFSISLSVAGTIFIGILYAMLTERLLSAKWSFLRRRSPIPRRDHIVLVGLGQIGQHVALLLENLRQPIVGMSDKLTDADSSTLANMPLVIGGIKDVLHQVNLPTAKGVVILTEDEVTNLEIGLMAHKANPDLNLVIGTFNPLFAHNVDRLLPYATVLEVYQLSAEAFAAAAFGENVLNLFDLNDQTILITEYYIDGTDELHGLLLADVAYGYRVVPILHGRSGHTASLLPTDDLRLQIGDRLVVLTTIEGLRRIEQGDRLPRNWLVQIDRALNQTAAFEGGNAIARIAGCGLELARAVMAELPTTLNYPLYKHQALRLVRALNKVQVFAQCDRLPHP